MRVCVYVCLCVCVCMCVCVMCIVLSAKSPLRGTAVCGSGCKMRGTTLLHVLLCAQLYVLTDGY